MTENDQRVRSERDEEETGAEVRREFAEAARLVTQRPRLLHELRQHHSKSPVLSGGDLDAAWDRADAGEETVGGSAPTPDQNLVDELGRALGLTYADDEPLDTSGKIAARDHHRWELDPASAEDYQDRQH